MFCGQCGAQAPDNAKFCTQCGFKFQSEPAPAAPAPEAQPAPPPNAAPAAPAYNQPPVNNQPPAAPANPQKPAAPAYNQPPVNNQAPSAPANPQKPAAPAYNQTPAYTPPAASVYTPPAAPVYTAPAAQANYAPNRAPAGPAGPGHSVLHALGKSPVILIAIIAFTLASILAIVQNVLSMETVSDFTRSLLKTMDADKDVLSAFETATGASMWSSIVMSAVISGLLIAGMWITWFTVRRTDNRMTTSGLTMIRVIETITLVFVCIACGITLLAAVAGGIGISATPAEANSSSAADMPEIAELILKYYFVFAAALVAFLVLSILYYAGIVRSVKRMRATVKTGEPNHKVSWFVAVVNILIAVVSVARVSLTGFALESAENLLKEQEAPEEVIDLLSFGEVSTMAIAQTALMAVALFCFGLFLFKYRKAMKAAQQN